MRSENKPASETPTRQGSGATVHHKEKSVGDALRAVYREAVDETIPDELLDLLKKLD